MDEVTLAFCSTSLITSNSILGRAQIGGGGFVDQLMDDRLALGDFATLSVDRDETCSLSASARSACSFFWLRPPGLPDCAFRKRVCNGGPPCNRAGRPPYAGSFASAIRFCLLSQRGRRDSPSFITFAVVSSIQ
jgi:hypothetical protein